MIIPLLSLLIFRRATAEIKTLTAAKFDLQDQCEKLLTVNEELADNLSKVLRSEAEARRENERIVAANDELFSEAQRLSDEEERWAAQREQMETEVKGLRQQVGQKFQISRAHL